MKFHTTINSFYIQVIRIKYSTSEYMKLHLKYFYKGSNVSFTEERNAKVRHSAMEHWKIYVD